MPLAVNGMRAFISNGTLIASSCMTIGERIEERRKALGIPSQSELARRADVGQSTLSGLIRKPYRSSPYLPQIARALQTTVDYLAGQTDDPERAYADEPSVSSAVFLAVTLPSEDALAEGFEALLLASEDMQRAELARELAKRLPLLLRVAANATASPPSELRAAAVEAEEPRAAVQRKRQRA